MVVYQTGKQECGSPYSRPDDAQGDARDNPGGTIPVPVHHSRRGLSSLLIPLALLPGMLAIILASSHTVPSATPVLPTPRTATVTAPATP
ncbi:MAG: hypothetical protein ACRDGS_07620, partial [Chloroflexota bacterium]